MVEDGKVGGVEMVSLGSFMATCGSLLLTLYPSLLVTFQRELVLMRFGGFSKNGERFLMFSFLETRTKMDGCSDSFGLLS
jgi:hypothetical protein